MPTPQITRAARTAIVGRLADPSNGFTPRLLSSITDAGLTIPLGWKLPIDFTATGRSFFQADISPEDLDETTVVTYPAIALYSLRASNSNREKYRLFSGEIDFGLNVYVSWLASKALPDFETIGDCVEEALFGTFNAEQTIAWSVNHNVVYNGDLSVARSRLSRTSENWFQTFASRLTVEVHTAG